MGCCSSAAPRTVACPPPPGECCGISVRAVCEYVASVREEFLAYCGDHAALSGSSHACRRPECPWDHCGVEHVPASELSHKAREGLAPLEPDMHVLAARYLRPQSQSSGCSIARMLNPEGTCFPEVFVSHCWSQPVEELLSTLKLTLNEEASVFLAGFSLSPLGGAEAELEKRPCAQALEGAKTFLLVVDDRAKVFTRLWCLYELHLACRLQQPVRLAAAAMTGQLHGRVEEHMQELRVRSCHASSLDDCQSIWASMQGREAEVDASLRDTLAKALSSQANSSGFGSLPTSEVPEEGEAEVTYVNGSVYQGQFRLHKRDGFGTLMRCDGVRFEGQWRDDVREGEGKEQWPDGTTFEGQCTQGLRCGHGAMKWPEGSYYEGQFERGRANGEGFMLRTDGSKYRGQFFEDAICGQGSMTWLDGCVYEGQFVANRRDGEGRMAWPEGTWQSYAGQWQAGAQHGQGVLVDREGKAQTGLFAQGRLVQWKQAAEADKAAEAEVPEEGEGTVDYPGGTRYEGQFRNHKREGFGTLTYANGDRFEGEWKNDRRHGRCKETFGDGSTFEGHVEEGLRCGHGVMSWPEGSTYSGQFERGKANGQGRLIRTDGSVYEGQFCEDTMTGQGNLRWPDGVAYEGEFLGNRRHGQGRMQWPSGRWQSYDGQWVQNTQHGRGTLVCRQTGEVRSGVFEHGKLVQWEEPTGTGSRSTKRHGNHGHQRAGLEAAARASGEDLAQVELLPAVAEGGEEAKGGSGAGEAPSMSRSGACDSRLAGLWGILEEARTPPQGL